MPTYDYRCRDCGHTIEIVHSILEDGPDACERCRGPLVRVLHPAGVIFKGSGFYVTDSRKTDSPKVTGSSDGPAAGAGGDGGSTAPRSEPKAPESGGASSSTASGTGGKGGKGTPAD